MISCKFSNQPRDNSMKPSGILGTQRRLRMFVKEKWQHGMMSLTKRIEASIGSLPRLLKRVLYPSEEVNPAKIYIDNVSHRLYSMAL